MLSRDTINRSHDKGSDVNSEGSMLKQATRVDDPLSERQIDRHANQVSKNEAERVSVDQKPKTPVDADTEQKVGQHQVDLQERNSNRVADRQPKSAFRIQKFTRVK